MTQSAVPAPRRAPPDRSSPTALSTAARRYGVAIIAVGVSLLVRLALNVVWGDRLPYLVFFPAVLSAALYGGAGPGLLATLLSTLAVLCFVYEPTFSLRPPTPEAATGVVGFCLVAGMMVLVADSQRRAKARAEARATLERGFSTGGTLGHGFWPMLRSCGRIYLLTGEGGTTVVLEQERAPQPLPWGGP